MSSVTSEQVQQHLPELLQRVQHGETLVILHNGNAIGQLGPLAKTRRPVTDRLGLLAGEANIPENWKELSRNEIEAEFYGE